MANDFLAVDRLKLLRVEVVPGAYNLVFERKHRQIILNKNEMGKNITSVK